MALTPRTAGRFYLELDTLPCGFLRSVEGGSVKAEVVTDAHEKSGALVVLDPGLKELGRVKLEGLGIHRLDSEKVEASKDAVARVVADLYCERMELAL
jgi:hypothetical protein